MIKVAVHSYQCNNAVVVSGVQICGRSVGAYCLISVFMRLVMMTQKTIKAKVKKGTPDLNDCHAAYEHYAQKLDRLRDS